MIADFNVHINGKDKVKMEEVKATGHVYLSVSGAESDVVLFFTNTAAARVFLATALAELRPFVAREFLAER